MCDPVLISAFRADRLANDARAARVSAPLVSSSSSEAKGRSLGAHSQSCTPKRKGHTDRRIFAQSDLHLINGRDTETDKSGRDFPVPFQNVWILGVATIKIPSSAFARGIGPRVTHVNEPVKSTLLVKSRSDFDHRGTPTMRRPESQRRRRSGAIN